ncbi:MAG: DUF1956 domain-containing protein [Denitromonas halophila]|nr:MAG: DUF1956 domain-containing protein [Denitromonas halophila]TVT68099.1 MAG: DUF1956 domain-containing protein [Denitromonas halophila]
MPRKPLAAPATGYSNAEDTRRRLIKAGLAVFSAHGYDGVTTRLLADQAHVNQSAIPYHFGGKEGVYLAVADAICDDLAARLTPLLSRAMAHRDPAEALPDLLAALYRLSHTEAADRERFTLILFEQQHPSAAFERFHSRLLQPLLDTLARLVGTLRDLPADAEATRLQAHMLLGLVSSLISRRASFERQFGSDQQLAPAIRVRVEAELRQMATEFVLGMRGPAPRHRA